jgi:hypothetical protein
VTNVSLRQRRLRDGDLVRSIVTGKHYVIHGWHEADGRIVFYKAHHISDRLIENTFLPRQLETLTAREKAALIKRMKAGNFHEVPVHRAARRRSQA